MSNFYGLPVSSTATGSSANLSSLTGLYQNPSLVKPDISSLTLNPYFAVPQPPASRSGIVAEKLGLSGASSVNKYGLPLSTSLTGSNSSLAPATGSNGISPSSSTGANTSSKPKGATYSGYDAAVYAAATSYLQSKTQGAEKQWLSKAGGSSLSAKPGFPAKKAYQTGQLYYCELCKISCAGPQTYREHLEGQKHKKRESEKKSGDPQAGLARSKTSYRCELCEIVCTGQDAYAAHVRGVKHQRAIKLHQTLGKNIPGTAPTVIPAKASDGSKLKIVLPTVNFVGGETLHSTMLTTEKTKGTGANSQPLGGGGKTVASVPVTPVAPVVHHNPDNDPLPIGEDYIEPKKSGIGKLFGYHCKLCDCDFTDVNAKDMHLKGRRHRLQFKKKVNPDLEVEIPKSYAYGMMKGRGGMKKFSGFDRGSVRSQDLQGIREAFGGGSRPPVPAYNFGMQQHPIPGPGMRLSPPNFQHFMAPQMPCWGSGSFSHVPEPIFTPPEYVSQPMLDNDRYVKGKHDDIYPKEQELHTVQHTVIMCEQALKCVSDQLTEEDTLKNSGSDVPPSEVAVERVLKGVMRVGVLAKGLLLHNNIDAELVVLCTEKPTVTLLDRVFKSLPSHLESVSSGEKFSVEHFPELACVTVSSTIPPVTKMTIVFTSALIRDLGSDAKPDPPDLLNKQMCLEALASLRHAKWFQAKCSNSNTISVVLRVMRDLCQRVPTWSCLPVWALELLTERIVSSANGSLTPGETFRKIFEAVSAGCFLQSGPGLLDPCEKEKTDALAPLTNQQREDITASAQHALRLISFGQIYKVLGVDLLPEDGGPIPVRKRPLEEDCAEFTVETKKERFDEDVVMTDPVTQ